MFTEEYKSTIAAGLAAYTESLIDYPWIGLKIKLQSAQRVNFTPRELFRGLVAFQASLIPSILVQEKFDHAYRTSRYYNRSSILDCIAYCIAGIPAALIATPVERIILEQQKSKKLLFISIKAVVNNHGVLNIWRGFLPTVGREAGFAIPIWWGGAFLSSELKRQHIPFSGIIGPIVAGFFGAVISHPFDVIGTRMQYELNTSMPTITKSIWRENGIGGFFPGFLFRTISIAGATYWIPFFTEKYSSSLDPWSTSAKAPTKNATPFQATISSPPPPLLENETPLKRP